MVYGGPFLLLCNFVMSEKKPAHNPLFRRRPKRKAKHKPTKGAFGKCKWPKTKALLADLNKEDREILIEQLEKEKKE